MNTIKTVLWPTDASDAALKALQVADMLAQTFNARIYALHVVEPIPRPIYTGMAGDPLVTFDFPVYEQQLVDSARENLVKTVSNTLHDSVERDIFVETGQPKEIIVRFASEKNVDVIVMATHGRTGLAHMMLGSVTESTIRQAGIPVLAVPVADH